MPRRDLETLELFDLSGKPIAARPSDVPGSLNVGIEVRHLISQAIRECPSDRYQIAARMSRYLGVDVTKFQIDSWTAESRPGWRFPLEYLPAFEAACETTLVTEYLAQRRGGRFMAGSDVVLAEIAKLEREEARLKARRRALRRYMTRGTDQ